MLSRVLLLSILTLLPLHAQASALVNRAEANCKTYSKMSDAELTKLYAKVHKTAAWVRGQCNELEHVQQNMQNPTYARAQCRSYMNMSTLKLAALARQSHVTVATIRHACNVLNEPESSGGGSIPNSCPCDSTHVCVRNWISAQCLDLDDKENVCNQDSDCIGRRAYCNAGNCSLRD